MSTQANKALVKRFIDAANAHDEARLDELLAPDLAERWRQSVLPFLRGTFAGHHMLVKNMIADGDHVVVRIRTTGLHSGEWHGIPATNKPWANDGVYFVRVVNGKLVEIESLFNELDHIKQLGARIVPATEAEPTR